MLSLTMMQLCPLVGGGGMSQTTSESTLNLLGANWDILHGTHQSSWPFWRLAGVELVSDDSLIGRK